MQMHVIRILPINICNIQMISKSVHIRMTKQSYSCGFEASTAQTENFSEMKQF